MSKHSESFIDEIGHVYVHHIQTILSLSLSVRTLQEVSLKGMLIYVQDLLMVSMQCLNLLMSSFKGTCPSPYKPTLPKRREIINKAVCLVSRNSSALYGVCTVYVTRIENKISAGTPWPYNTIGFTGHYDKSLPLTK